MWNITVISTFAMFTKPNVSRLAREVSAPAQPTTQQYAFTSEHRTLGTDCAHGPRQANSFTLLTSGAGNVLNDVAPSPSPPIATIMVIFAENNGTVDVRNVMLCMFHADRLKLGGGQCACC
ncbi:hypothetical protein CDEST_06523 [Colletotrichum destructivum]|uniref:Uncharacterized protein n=1 Tax=Colletotrichum destructivum TaxID=34406 RepID=A0AAX4IE32_9PEZI|nr:hypothetical protein CDEST_06523 [Colletotrichum destructivum]